MHSPSPSFFGLTERSQCKVQFSLYEALSQGCVKMMKYIKLKNGGVFIDLDRFLRWPGKNISDYEESTDVQSQFQD